jgi:ketosteroid isomerase-like protein
MSQQNIEVVRRLYEAWRRDGFGVVPELMDPAVEWVNPSYAVETGTRHGYEGFAAASEALSSVYGDYRVSSARFYDVEDRVAVTGRMSTRSLGNEIPIDATRGYVFDIRDGRVVRFAWFNDPAEALREIGLEA